MAGATGWVGVAAFYLAAYVVLRLSVAWAAGSWGLGDKMVTPRLWLVPLRDAISAVVLRICMGFARQRLSGADWSIV